MTHSPGFLHKVLTRASLCAGLAVLITACGGGSTSATSASTSTGSTTTGSGTTGTTGGTTTTATSVAAVSSVTVIPATNTINTGGAFQLSAVVKDSNGNTLSGRAIAWSSSNPAVASVSADGVVTGVTAGTVTLTATVEGQRASAAASVVAPGAPTILVKVDAAKTGSTLRDLVGVNRKPVEASQTAGTNWDGIALYKAFGISQIRLHDSGIDLCAIYKAATKVNNSVTPAQAVSGCTLVNATAGARFTWTPSSSADSDLNNPDNYDFSAADETIRNALATGASLVLRLGEGTGPNDTADPVAWAKVATNIYRHVIGAFKPTTGIAVDPAMVEILNEPDGGFWRGDQATFNTLFTETSQRVRAAAAAAGRSVVVGGAGFTRSLLTTATRTGNPANNFISNVGASNLDFFSAHLYDNCSTATLPSAATFLRGVRSLVNSQGGSTKPLVISEWNIGLTPGCATSVYADQRTQSFDSGVLTLMQDPAQNIQAAHFYAGMPIMALFDFSSASGVVRVNPAAWAFWAHARLKGATSLDSQVCPQGTACVAGYAAESAALMALAGQNNGAQNIVVTNDTAGTVTYALQVNGLSGSTVNATIHTPPAGTRDLPVAGNPLAADATALATLIASVAKDTRSALSVVNGQLLLTLTIPGQSLQVVELRNP